MIYLLNTLNLQNQPLKNNKKLIRKCLEKLKETDAFDLFYFLFNLNKKKGKNLNK
jgi:hypothetical protein